MSFDYVFPEFVTSILKKPSERTQMESSLIGITIMMLGSLGVVIYMLANGIVTGFWFILLICSSELGLLSFQFGILSTTYQTYRNYKLEMDFYPLDYRLKIKLIEAKRIKEDLNNTINKIELENTKVLKEDLNKINIQTKVGKIKCLKE